MNKDQRVNMPDVAARRKRLDEWLPRAMEIATRHGKTDREVEEDVELAGRRCRVERWHRVWSDGTVTLDTVIDGDGRRIDVLGPILSDGDLSLDAWQRMIQQDGSPGILPHRVPEEESRHLSIFTYWEGDRETCMTVRMLLAEWVAALTSVERDELMLERDRKPQWQVGTEEPNEVVGSRAARGSTLADAVADAMERSRGRGIRSAWVREDVPGRGLGPVLVTFVKGRPVAGA